MTQRSSPASQLLPKWMFEKTIDYLIEHDEVIPKILTDELRVMRSAFVMAPLAKLEYIRHEQRKARISLRF